ncbi:MAG: SCO family protein [Candidatus Competibacter phosphatis]
MPSRFLAPLLPLASLLLVFCLPWLPQDEQRPIHFPWLDQQMPHHDNWWVFFGYVGCPDICPDTLTKLRNAYQRLPAGSRPGVLLIDVTTKVDPDLLTRYAQGFHPDFQAYAPTLGELKRLGNLFGVKIRPRTDRFSPDHSGAVYQLRHAGPDWMLVRTFQDRRLGPNDLVAGMTSGQ